MSAQNQIKVAVSVVENHLAGADSRAAYWAVELGIRLDMPEDHKPGDIANKFLLTVRRSLEAANDTVT